MSTRANIIIKDSMDKLIFYRHSDGSPKTTAVSLNVFMSWLKTGKIRDNVPQAAGWIIMLGAIEDNTIPKFKKKRYTWYKGKPTGRHQYNVDLNSIVMPDNNNGMGWKVGAYQPTTEIHGDIAYLYIIDVEKKTIECYDSWTDEGEGENAVDITEYITTPTKA